jgi:hypothetical protein
MLPPVDLDALLNKKLASLTTGGYDVYSGPFFTPKVPLGDNYSSDIIQVR